MTPRIAAEEASDRRQPCVRESLSCITTSVRNLQTLLDERDFDGLTDVFLRICREGVGMNRRSKAGLMLTDASHSSNAPMRLYLEGTRPSSASTAVPSSSLSLCSASMDPSSGASELPHEQGHAVEPNKCEYSGKRKNMPPLSRSVNVADAKRSDGRREDDEGEASPCAALGRQEGEYVHPSDAYSSAATPSKRGTSLAGSRSKVRRNANPMGNASASLTRRSPRLQKTGQCTPRHEPLHSPPPDSHKKQQTWGCSSGTCERSKAQLNRGRPRQGTAAAYSCTKRRREEGDADADPPANSTGGCRSLENQQEATQGDSGALSPPKSSISKLKRNCSRGVAAASSWPRKPPRKVQVRGLNMWQRKKTRIGEVKEVQADALQAPSPGHSQEASEGDDEPVCRFALPVLKEGAGDTSRTDADHSADALIELPDTSVQHDEIGATEEELRSDEGRMPSGDGEVAVVALQHKVLRALPEPTPQFDFGLFIIRAAAMSKHVDDIFPLLEDEELMERSTVLQRYLGPPKEGAKRRGDYFMLDKLLAEIPNQGGVYRPFLDIKEAPWCTGLDSAGDGKVLSKKEVLRQRIQVQRRWNPFSIFGSSPPSVELEDVFGYEVYQRTAPSARVHHPLFRRLSQFQSFKDLYSSISREEWDRVSSAFRRHWNKQCRLDLDWTNDPLTIDEIMWMLEANEQVEDRSSHVYEAEICYCVTPNPNVGFGWNDPRCHRYKAPRPSMGCHILTQPPIADESFEDQAFVAQPQEPSTREPSSSSEAADPKSPNKSFETVSKPEGEEPANTSQQAAAERFDTTNADETQKASSKPTDACSSPT